MADLVVVGVKVPPVVKERWIASAERSGVTLSVWVRGACEERVRATVSAGDSPIGGGDAWVARRDPPSNGPSPVSVGTPFHVKMRDEAPRIFREGCSGSHVAGVVCSSCGGRMW